MHSPVTSRAGRDAVAPTAPIVRSAATDPHHRHSDGHDDDLAGLRRDVVRPFMPSLLRPAGAPPAATTADVVDLLAQLRAVVGLGVEVERLGHAVVEGRRGA